MVQKLFISFLLGAATAEVTWRWIKYGEESALGAGLCLICADVMLYAGQL